MEIVKVIAFDCDGVMFDSADANKAYYNALLKHLGLPKMNEKQALFAQSHTFQETLAELVKNTSLLSIANEYRRHLNYKNVINLMKIEPNLRSTLEKIRPKIKTAVATNRTNTIHEILKYNSIDHLFDFVISSSNVPFPKPDPCMLNEISNHFGVHCRSIVYVGDSKSDEIASDAAGIKFIAYNNISLNAFYHIDSLASIENLISHINRTNSETL